LSGSRKHTGSLNKIKEREALSAIRDAVFDLADWPNCRSVTALKNHESRYRLRVGSWRVLFEVHTRIHVIVIQEMKNAMNKPTNVQIIKQDGHPVFVVIPYEEYVRIFPKSPRIPKSGNIPNDVVWLSIDKGYTLARAWREYLGLTQKEVAARMGISQAALSQMESGEKKLRKASLEKLAVALGVTVEQLRG